MDRFYIYGFFYQRTILTIEERAAFAEMYIRILRAASERQASITQALEKPEKNTSSSKVVDNAIIGYMIDRKKMKPPSDAPDLAATSDP
jgi:hypothetical protein